jgi:hypothetical protein
MPSISTRNSAEPLSRSDIATFWELSRSRQLGVLNLSLFNASEESVVRFVRANPEPVELATFPVCDRSIRAADIGRPDLAFLLQGQGGMKRILFEQGELGIGHCSYSWRKQFVAIPKLGQGK